MNDRTRGCHRNRGAAGLRDLALRLAVACLPLTGCNEHILFPCDDDTQCVISGVQGWCEASPPYCSYPSDTCDSGRRFGNHAAMSIAGRCVPPEDDPPTPPLTTGSETSTGEASGGSSSSATASTTGDAATYEGVRTFASLYDGDLSLHAWRYDEVLFFTWVDDLAPDEVARWSQWYADCVDTYAMTLQQEIPLAEDSNLGSGRIFAVVDVEPMNCETGTASICAEGGVVQGARASGDDMRAHPDSPVPHWPLLFGIGRGLSTDTLDGRAVWPTDAWRSVVPHAISAMCLTDADAALLVPSDAHQPGRLLEQLARWERSPSRFATTFAEGWSAEGFFADQLIAAMLLRVRTDYGTTAVVSVFDAVAEQPIARDPTTALCGLVDAINAATNDELDETLRGPWGLPEAC